MTPAGDRRRLAACVALVDQYLRDAHDALPRCARKSLIYAAHDALDHDEENRLFAMAEEVESLAPIASEAFRNAILSRLKSPGEGQPDDPATEDGAGLTLVDTGKVDDWLRMRKIVERHGDQARALEAELWRRLAHAAGVSPNPDNSPVSVPGMCRLFHASMRNLNAGHEARAAIYDAFDETVVTGLGALTRLLLEILDTPDDAPVIAPGTPALPAEAPDPNRSVSPPRPPAGQTPGSTAEPDSEPPPRRESGSTPHPGMPAPDGEPLPDMSSMDPVRVLGAIASVERQMLEVSTGQGLQALSELENRLTAALTPPGAPLGKQDRRAVHAVAGLVHQAFAHPGIDPAVRARLWKLAPSLALLALQDDDQLDLVLQASRHDPITGLLDRTAFRVRLEGALASAASSRRQFAVCFIGVDGFGNIGERLGQQVAGRVLRVLADLMRGCADPSSHLARLRGAEFAALLPASQRDTGWRFANHYLSKVNKAHFALAGNEVSLTVSIGVVESDPSLTTVAQVMRAADAAHQAAREDGGGCARVHIPDSFS